MSAAHALCIYHGEMYAKTTIAQEFADSQWVVRVKEVAADDQWLDYEEDPWTIYHLKVLTAFKGKLPARIEMLTYRNSGGFYLDKGVRHDLGGEYLLFINPVSREENAPSAAQDAMEVNYSCGQSKTWASVTRTEREHLLDLSRER